jgi:TP901-1 family phage major tail protein
MAVETGLTWKVWVDTNENVSPNWVDLPQQRTGNLSWGSSDADATNKDNAGWTDSVTTSRSLTISCDGFGDPDDTAILYLEDSVQYGSSTDHAVYIKMQNADGDVYWTKAKIDSWDLSYGYDEVVSYSVSFTSRGTPTLTRA